MEGLCVNTYSKNTFERYFLIDTHMLFFYLNIFTNLSYSDGISYDIDERSAVFVQSPKTRETVISRMAKFNLEGMPVKLKGVGDSLWVTLDPTQSEDILKDELKKIFVRLKHMAINARVIIDSGIPGGDEELINRLGRYLRENFDVGHVSGPPPKRSMSLERRRQRDVDDSWTSRGSDVLMLAGRVRSGQKVSAKKHLVLLGDVNPGGEVVAGGDILIMGRLLGLASAGQPGNETAIILALEFRPTQIQIGGFVAAGLNSSTIRTAEYAHVEDGVVVVEAYLESNPFSRLQWPEVR